MSEWQPFTKADVAEVMPAAAKARFSSVDQYGLKRIAKSEAKTPPGMMRLGDKIIEEGLPQLAADKSKNYKGTEQRCVTVDPNAYRTRSPFTRVESPHVTRNRRLPEWTDCRVILPKLTLEGLRALAIKLAHEQQNSDWPGERRRYARTKNFYIVWALNELFKRLGFEEFCVEEQKPLEKHRVRRFVAPSV